MFLSTKVDDTKILLSIPLFVICELLLCIYIELSVASIAGSMSLTGSNFPIAAAPWTFHFSNHVAASPATDCFCQPGPNRFLAAGSKLWLLAIPCSLTSRSRASARALSGPTPFRILMSTIPKKSSVFRRLLKKHQKNLLVWEINQASYDSSDSAAPFNVQRTQMAAHQFLLLEEERLHSAASFVRQFCPRSLMKPYHDKPTYSFRQFLVKNIGHATWREEAELLDRLTNAQTKEDILIDEARRAVLSQCRVNKSRLWAET